MNINLEKQLNLRKEKVLDLKKKRGLDGQKAQVVFVADFSGSMDRLYRTGKVQETSERLLPLGLAFDDNGEVDFYLFHHSYHKLPENITMKNVENYINDKVIGKYSMGSTNYAPVINSIIDDFAKRKKVGGGLFSKAKYEYEKLDYPVYVIFMTDGNNDDKSESEAAVIEASKTGIFFQFVGIGREQFRFLQKLDDLPGRNIDNANFMHIVDVNALSDDDLYEMLLREFPSYVKEAKLKNLIK